jgi:carboxymethylenebutenolidase
MPANATGKLPGILVVHENRGLNPHIEDITRRLALDNFIAFAPDALTPLGGYPGDEDKAREAFAKLDQAKTREDFLAAAQV